MPVHVQGNRGHAVAAVTEEPACARCDGHGNVEVVLDGVRRIGRCRCRRPHDAASVWNAAHVPAVFADAALDPAVLPIGRSPSDVALRFVAAWLRDLGDGAEGGIFLYGDPGVGKTWLAVAALRHLVFGRGRPVPARFIDLDRYVQDFKASFDDEGQHAAEDKLAVLGTRPILVIDDLNGTGSEFDRRIADDLISRRAAHGGITIITSNRTPEALGQVFPDRVASRLTGMCRSIHVQGPDRRRPAPRRPLEAH